MSKKLLLLLCSFVLSGPLVSATIFTASGTIAMKAVSSGLSVIDVPSGALKVCGFENPSNTQEFDLFKIANQMRCDEISDLKDHCGCIFQYGGSELKAGEVSDLEAELGYLSEATSTTKQKALNDLANANAILNMYGLIEVPRKRNTCIEQRELEDFEREIDRNLKDSIARKDEIPSLARKDFLNQAKTVNNFTATPKSALIADELFLNDLSKLIKTQSLFNAPDKVGFPGSEVFLKYQSSGKVDVLTSLPKDMSNPDTCLSYGFDKSYEVNGYLNNPSTDLDKYKDSPLFKVYSQLPANKKLNFSDYLGRLSVTKDYFEGQSRAPLLVKGVDALRQAAASVPIDEFLEDECQRITEQVKYESSSNYSEGKFQSKFLDSKKIIAQRNGEVLLDAEDGAGDLERISNLRLQYSKKYKEALSGLDEDEKKVLLTEKLFNFSKLLCGKLKKEDQMAYTIERLNNLENANELLSNFETAKEKVDLANTEIERLRLELINLDRGEQGITQSINYGETREKELKEEIERVEKRSGRNRSFANRTALLKSDLESVQKSLANNRALYEASKEKRKELVSAIKAAQDKKGAIIAEAGLPSFDRPAEIESLDPGPLKLKTLAPVNLLAPTILSYDINRPLFSKEELGLDTELKLNIFDNYEVVERVREPAGEDQEATIVKSLERIEEKKKVFTGTTIGQDKVTLENSSVSTNRTVVAEMKRVEITREAMSDTLEEIKEKKSEMTDDETRRARDSVEAGLDLIGGSVSVQKDIIEQADTDSNIDLLKGVVSNEFEKSRGFVAERKDELDGLIGTENLEGNVANDVMFTGEKTREILSSLGQGMKDLHSGPSSNPDLLAGLTVGKSAGIADLFNETHNVKEADRSNSSQGSLLSSKSRGLSEKFGEAEELGMALASGVKSAGGLDSDANKVMERAQELLAERGYDVPELSYSGGTASSPKAVKKSLETQKVELKRKNKIQRQIARDMQIENMGIAREVAQTKDTVISKNVEKELKVRDVRPEEATEAIAPTLERPSEVTKGPIEKMELSPDKIGTPSQLESEALTSASEAESLSKKLKEKINIAKDKKKAAKVAAAPVKKPAVSSGESTSKGKASVSSPSPISSGAGASSSRGPASVSGQLVDNSFELGYDRTKAFSSKKFDLTPILDGVDDDLYIRIPSFEAPDDFLKLSEQKREEWVNKQFEESKAEEAVVVFPDGKKLLVKKKNLVQ